MNGARWAVLFATVGVLGSLVALGLYVVPTDDELGNPDAVVVLGGAGGERAELGIELAEEHDATLVLSSTAALFGERQGRTCGEDAICFDPIPENTAGEAANVANMADEHGWGHVTVATSRFHTSRSRLLFRQCMDDDVTVVGVASDDHRTMEPRLLLRESVGVVAAATVRRAC